jgi:ElaB/YqjD/DUF883 family membrane-anchored ribosome-binding protein
MAAEETVASIPANMDVALEQSRESARRLLDSLARKVGASRAAEYVKTHSAREMAEEFTGAVKRRPIYALVAAVAAGLLIGCLLKRSLPPRE